MVYMSTHLAMFMNCMLWEIVECLLSQDLKALQETKHLLLSSFVHDFVENMMF